MEFGVFGGPFGRHGHGFWGEGRHGGGHRRFKRGMLKWVVLKLLAEEERHGYGFLQALREQGWGAGPGALYPVLSKLEEAGLVTSREENGKRIYTVTDAGREYLRDHGPHHLGDVEREEPEDETNPELRDAMRKLMAAVMQGARTAKPETVQQIAEKVTALRKEIYTLLANE
ncbi:MAG TPA: PadR family transcriptional regulator [Candidatus Baltobacteraceae bacterium]|jgi:DNA-binding PadR family transcriptional regulator|nr:PadR family transcriptional regulator [Candidatus Baltobacteraceae bacterium]